MLRWVLLLGLLVGWSGAARGAVHEKRLALHEGRVSVAELSALMLDELHLPAWRLPVGQEIDLRGLKGNLYLAGLNQSLGEGCRIQIDNDELVLRFDSAKLPRSGVSVKRAVREFVARVRPEATAAQQRTHGLFLPERLVETKPLVVLVHGLDCNRENWAPMAELLSEAGHQVAYFSYPSDQPIEDSAAMFGRELRALSQSYPATTVQVITHSMGALVARGYIEGENYAGNVSHLVMIAPPNHGSKWSAYRIGLEVQEHYQLWKSNPEWRWSWMITDGLGEAGPEMKPKSDFLTALNSAPRRQGVKYTIIAGSNSTLARVEAGVIEAPANWVPYRVEHWWGIRQGCAALRYWSDQTRAKQGDSDGPVKIKSAELEGVSDVVVLKADHTALYYPVDGQEPAAWETIRERLK